MNKDIPEIDELLSGINQPAVINPDAVRKPSPEVAGQPDVKEETEDDTVEGSPTGLSEGMEELWQEILKELLDDSHIKDRTAYCMIDRDLADTLDVCRIYGKRRTGLVNAILRVGIRMFLPKLEEYRIDKKSYFQSTETS